MDASNPLRSLTPSVDADVLAVLGGTQVPLSGLQVQQLAGRSYGQVRTVLHRLVDHGVVCATDHRNSVAYVLNREHILAAPVLAVLDAPAAVERTIRYAVDEWSQPPEAVVVFGSFARREATKDSDIDLALIRPDDIADHDTDWVDQKAALVAAVEALAGNRVQIVELSAGELTEAVETRQPLVGSLQTDGVVLWGSLEIFPGARGVA